MTDFSIIVCTRNRVQSLACTLQSIAAAISHAPALRVEAVLVDNASTDSTKDVLTRWAESMPFPVTTTTEPRKGLSHARNTGVLAARGAVLAFTDDDCRLHPDYFLVLDQHYREDACPIVRGGRVALGDPTDLPIGLRLGDQALRLGDLDHPGNFIIGANMVIPRSVIEEVGLFDARFGAGGPFLAAEETDYVYRCYLQGIPVEYVPDLIVFHFHGRKDRRTIKRLNSGYHVGGGALYAKYFTRWHLLRHFYWDVRKCVQSLWNGPLYDSRLQLSYWDVINGNLRGMGMYALHRLAAGFRHRVR